jgi:hypothetical protein
VNRLPPPATRRINHLPPPRLARPGDASTGNKYREFADRDYRKEARFRSLVEPGEPCLRNLFVRAEGADHLAVDYHRKPALHLDEAASGYRRTTTVTDCVLQR